MKNSCELYRVVQCYRTELCVRYRPGVRTQAKDRCVRIREHLRECRAISEVLMDNLIQLGMRDTDLSPPDGRHTSNGGVSERISKRASTDHSGRTHDDKVLLDGRRSDCLRLRGAYRTPHPVCRCHEGARSSNQS